MVIQMLPMLAESPRGLDAGDYALLTGLLVISGALARTVEALVKHIAAKRANGNGYHKHKRSEDTREIAAEAKEAGATEATVDAIKDAVRGMGVDAREMGERVTRVEERVDALGQDVREVKAEVRDGFEKVRESLGTIHRRIDDALNGKGKPRGA